MYSDISYTFLSIKDNTMIKLFNFVFNTYKNNYINSYRINNLKSLTKNLILIIESRFWIIVYI